MKKNYNYICIVCKKQKKSVINNKIICDKCKKWTAPGIGQLNLFKNIYEN